MSKPTSRSRTAFLIVTFARPVAVSTEQAERRLSGYVQAVRRDPDGTALRMSLSRKVTVNVMEAGERLFVDLLPDSWSGLPPGLPQSVIDELAKRARWKDEGAFEPTDRHDVLRAALAYTLGAEAIGLSRVKEKFAEKMQIRARLPKPRAHFRASTASAPSSNATASNTRISRCRRIRRRPVRYSRRRVFPGASAARSSRL